MPTLPPAPKDDFVADVRAAADDLREAVIDALWRQWAVLGAMAASAALTRMVVDPEALVLMSLTMFSDNQGERRLGDLVASWGVINSSLVSVQRIGNLVQEYPESAQRHLGAMARLWVTEGKDHRWKSLADGYPSFSYRGEKARSIHVPVGQPAALLLRLRKAFGVGLRPDVLAFLLTTNGRPQSIRAIASATKYTQAPLRRAMNDMADAEIIDRVLAEGPDHFTIDTPRWSRALKLSSTLLAWPYWHDFFGATIALLEFRARADGSIGRTAVGALGRDVLQQHGPALGRAGFKDVASLADGVTALERAMQCLAAHYRVAQ